MVPNHAEKQILISTGLIDNNRWQSRKSNICVKLHPSSLRRTVRTPHSSGFARLDLELSTSPSLGLSTSEKKRVVLCGDDMLWFIKKNGLKCSGK